MDDSRTQAFGNLSDAQDGRPVVVELDDIPMADASGGGICRMKADGMPVIAVLFDAVGLYLAQPWNMPIVVSVEGHPRMRRNEMERIFAGQCGIIALPTRDVAGRQRALVVVPS